MEVTEDDFGVLWCKDFSLLYYYVDQLARIHEVKIHDQSHNIPIVRKRAIHDACHIISLLNWYDDPSRIDCQELTLLSNISGERRDFLCDIADFAPCLLLEAIHAGYPRFSEDLPQECLMIDNSGIIYVVHNYNKVELLTVLNEINNTCGIPEGKDLPYNNSFHSYFKRLNNLISVMEKYNERFVDVTPETNKDKLKEKIKKLHNKYCESYHSIV